MFNERVQTSRSHQREQTRDAVVAAAQRLFLRTGFRSATVRAIAVEAGVSTGTVMGVGDKDALLLECYDRWIGDVHAADDGGVRRADELTVPQRIGETVAPFVALFDEHPELAREYGSILTRGTHRTEVFTSLAVALNVAFADIYRDAGLGDRADAAGRTTYLAYLGLLMATAATGAPMRTIRDRLEEVAADLLGVG
ncbi:TetR/AcrR family transcriptional regulator [Gordonia hydrophobica]|uniref:TetR/AcrR family transcriptional regulator n=1 Tax=Gordonia hydrophobica TaxID=40516 RepID=A0ABZ2U0W6_9ACTN|nr:TetR/AcrR family transcriptional regulator [Gordonia hydrophobica]MBM7367624.1 AcrR family transcriptional regulator [Gordonia hydrophobica]